MPRRQSIRKKMPAKRDRVLSRTDLQSRKRQEFVNKKRRARDSPGDRLERLEANLLEKLIRDIEEYNVQSRYVLETLKQYASFGLDISGFRVRGQSLLSVLIDVYSHESTGGHGNAIPNVLASISILLKNGAPLLDHGFTRPIYGSKGTIAYLVMESVILNEAGDGILGHFGKNTSWDTEKAKRARDLITRGKFKPLLDTIRYNGRYWKKRNRSFPANRIIKALSEMNVELREPLQSLSRATTFEEAYDIVMPILYKEYVVKKNVSYKTRLINAMFYKFLWTGRVSGHRFSMSPPKQSMCTSLHDDDG